jgi:F-type H+-transporting ATPase subunit epsilon
MIYYEHSRSYPDRVICSTTADEIVLPGLTGQVGVLDGHAALITALDTGLLRIKLNENGPQSFYVVV